MKKQLNFHLSHSQNHAKTLFVGILATLLSFFFVLSTLFAPAPQSTIAEEDPVIGYTESGLEIKLKQGLTTSGFSGYSYVTLGKYSGIDVNWIIIGYYNVTNATVSRTWNKTATGTGTGDYQMYSLDAPVITPSNYNVTGTVTTSVSETGANYTNSYTTFYAPSVTFSASHSSSQTQTSSTATYAITQQEITQETPNSAGYGSYQALNGGAAGTAIANDTGTSTDVMSRFDTDFRVTGPISKAVTLSDSKTIFPNAVSNSEIPSGCVLVMSEYCLGTAVFGYGGRSQGVVTLSYDLALDLQNRVFSNCGISTSLKGNLIVQNTGYKCYGYHNNYGVFQCNPYVFLLNNGYAGSNFKYTTYSLNASQLTAKQITSKSTAVEWFLGDYRSSSCDCWYVTTAGSVTYDTNFAPTKSLRPCMLLKV